MEDRNILIIGSGHLANRLGELIEQRGFGCVHIQRPEAGQNGKDEFEQISVTLRGLEMKAFAMAYLLDDRDERNLEAIIALMRLNISFPVAVSLFNENVAPHLQAAYPNLTILSPARMAAPVFAEALNRQVEHRLRYTPAGRPGEIKVKVADRLVVRLIAGFIALIFFSTTYFHYSEHISWLDAFYFVVVTITSVGYGDITLLHSAAISKVLNIVLILSATVFIWMIFSLVIDRIIKKRIQLSLGQKQYDYKNHVIVCGLGRLGYCIVEELIKAGEKVIVVQNNADSDKADELRLRGVDVYVGNARSFAVLQDVNVINARGLISVIDNDYLNLEIGLNARSIRSDLPLVLRIVDEEMAVQLREDLDIHLTLSMSDLADDRFMSLLKNKTD